MTGTLNPQQFVPATVHMDWNSVPYSAPDDHWEKAKHSVCIDCAPKVQAAMAAKGYKPSKIEHHRYGVDPTHYCESCHPRGL